MRRLKKYLQYAGYFFRYNPLLAICLLYDEIKGERKYGIDTSGVEEPPVSRELDDKLNSYAYMPSNFVLLERLFRKSILFIPASSFMDLGCGKGRVLAVAAAFGYDQLYGVELSNEYCQMTCQLLTNLAIKYPALQFEITCGNASEYFIPDHVQVIFLYNPFHETIIKDVIKNILQSQARSYRPMLVIYLNSLFKDNFIQAGFKEVFHADRFYQLKGCILQYDKSIKKN